MTLFDDAPYRSDPEPGPGADARRTMRNLETLASGFHPVSGRALLADRPPLFDRKTKAPRCGTCTHLLRRVMGGTYLKCDLNSTGGPATDLRLWWPACTAYEEDTDD